MEDVWLAKPTPLCRSHALQVAEVIVPELIAESLRVLRTRQSPKTLTPEEGAALVDGSRALDPRNYLDGAHGPAVYVIENGSRVKIGYTTCLRRRINDLSLRDCNILLLLEGGPTLERALHSRFAACRVERTEWFALTDAVVAFVESKRAQLAEHPATTTLAELVAKYTPGPVGGNAEAEPDRQAEPAREEIEPEPVDGTPPAAPASLVLRFPDGSEIPDKDAALWQLLGEYGREGASVRQLAVRSEALGHRHTSEPWVRRRLFYWLEMGHAGSRKEAREEVFWRKDLRSERSGTDDAAS